jgi:hypothetical protein
MSHVHSGGRALQDENSTNEVSRADIINSWFHHGRLAVADPSIKP